VTDEAASVITCQTCGKAWQTSEETALLLEDIESHAATHVDEAAWPPRIYLRAGEEVVPSEPT
jgi:hypothetical protein